MSENILPIAKFRLGHVVSTPNALSRLTHEDILAGIKRHQAGDWGDMEAEDKKTNDCALTERRRILSVYHSATGTIFWIITEADRSATTILLPEDY
jgi:hypothetical protein